MAGVRACKSPVGVPPFLLASSGSALERRGSSLLLVMGEPSPVHAALRPVLKPSKCDQERNALLGPGWGTCGV